MRDNKTTMIHSTQQKLDNLAQNQYLARSQQVIKPLVCLPMISKSNQISHLSLHPICCDNIQLYMKSKQQLSTSIQRISQFKLSSSQSNDENVKIEQPARIISCISQTVINPLTLFDDDQVGTQHNCSENICDLFNDVDDDIF
ncbi:hypothetical protein SS50377_24904 [Spironucleus salmonicida]|uniref:Uncharacterized protein n=1 Tax=Spironucleus salmonicida TaxID=348837 RepID=V6LI98_9EUKA|nr:hypothetical protein SS50377_24904 [Spironucleus salmonicida]|eukprot:EST43436.1 Hypothetical protein SS50377_16798 [Spironucleus salmonicida]